MKIKESYITSLETAGVETVHGILDAKLNSTSPESLVDYVGFSIGNIEDAIAKMDKATAELKQMKANANSQIEMIKTQSAQWLSDVGISRLNGLIISSITINTPQPSYEVEISDETQLQDFQKFTIDKTKVKNALLNGEEIKGAKLITVVKNQTLKINKKRV
jgi:hypothetical protein